MAIWSTGEKPFPCPSILPLLCSQSSCCTTVCMKPSWLLLGVNLDLFWTSWTSLENYVGCIHVELAHGLLLVGECKQCCCSLELTLCYMLQRLRIFQGRLCTRLGAIISCIGLLLDVRAYPRGRQSSLQSFLTKLRAKVKDISSPLLNYLWK